MFTIPRQIADLDARLAEAVIVEDSDENTASEEVAIGTRVTPLIGDVEQSHHIGGAGGTSISDNVIFYEAPLAQAVLGAREGEERDFVSPRGSATRVKIVSITRD